MDLYKLFYNKSRVLILILTLTVLLSGCSQLEQMGILESSKTASYSLSEIPPYENSPYVVLEDNMPAFSEADMSTESFETYSNLDHLGRCGVAFANVGRDLMPTEKRGSIGMVKPSGWQLAKYDIVDGKYLYNRCHLLGYQLTGENAMLPFEDMVADYVKETGGHVLYRVTPIYDGNDLVARGVQMEGYSVEDDGEGVCFNVFVYNVQPGIEIDYSNGDNRLNQNNAAVQDDEEEKIVDEIRGNKRSKIYHCPGQRAYEEMEDSKNLIIFDSEEEAIEAGYRKAKQ